MELVNLRMNLMSEHMHMMNPEIIGLLRMLDLVPSQSDLRPIQNNTYL